MARLILLLPLLAALAQAQRFVPGYCPSPVPQESFDKTKVSPESTVRACPDIRSLLSPLSSRLSLSARNARRKQTHAAVAYADQFFGHWVEAEKTPSMFDLLMRCMELDYSDDSDGSINVVVRGVSL